MHECMKKKWVKSSLAYQHVIVITHENNHMSHMEPLIFFKVGDQT